jgi:class 3 adenylate cyclase
MTETAWRALQAAFAMQSTIAGFTIIPTSQGAFDLRMKVGMSAGELLEVHAGGELNRLEYVLAGEPMANMTRAENLAIAGEIVVDETIWQLTDGLDLDGARQMMASASSHHTSMPKSYVFGESVGSDFYRITHLWSRLPPTPLTYPEWSQLDAHAAAQVTATLYSYIPAAISNFFENGPESALAELRPMTVCFVGISGIDYNCDSEAGLRLHNFLRDAQKVIYHYEGSINKMDVGDKGSVLLVLFGAPPFYHQDDELRAVACALDLDQVAARYRLVVRIGLAAGPLFLGPLGAPQRREYTVIGDTVNLAARLMQKAETGQTLIDESIQRKARQFFSYQDLGQIQIKGRTEPRHAFLVLAVNEQTQQTSMLSYPFGNNDLETSPLASPAQVSCS